MGLLKISGIAITLLLMPVVVHGAVFLDEERIELTENLTSDLYAIGEAVVVPNDTAVSGDVFAVGKFVDVFGRVAGDLLAAGDQLMIKGVIASDVFGLGQKVTVDGSIGDDVHVAGNTLEIVAAKIDDLFAAGNNVHISSETTVDGDAYVAGSKIILEGTINGTARFAGERIVIEPTAVIAGNLITWSERAPEISDGATIIGRVERRQYKGAELSSQVSWQFHILNWVRAVISLFITSLVILFVLPRLSKAVLLTTQKRLMPSFGLGLLWLIIFIPVVIALAVTILGIHLGLVIVAATALLGLITMPLASLVVGFWIFRKLSKQGDNSLSWQHALLGSVILKSLYLVPIVGWLAGTFIVITVFGSMLFVSYGLLHTDNKPKITA